MGLFGRFKKQGRPRAVVVGLDGVPYTLLKDLIRRGHIPNMASIFETGYFGQMSVSIPEISSVSWSSFMTGTQSGEHGIFGFIDMESGSYEMYFPNFVHLRAPTLWDDLAAMGKKTVVINMPATYPARQINGVLISGFVAIDINKAVYPSSFIPRLKEMEYRIDVDTTKAREDHGFLLQDLDQTLATRERVVDLLWHEVEWDLFIVVITGTDRLMHFLWEAHENDKHPHHRDFLEYFENVDRFVGKVYDRYLTLGSSEGQKNHFYMLSDHGCTGIKKEVYLNRWLEENGYLKLNQREPGTIMKIDPRSTAFALDPSRLYVNLKGKYSLGTVDPADYKRVREELKQYLERLTFGNGDKIAKKVYYKEELYQGPCIERGPDLIILSNHGYDLKASVTKDTVFGRSTLTGMHTQDDAFFFSSNGLKCKSIFDAKGIIEDVFLDRSELKSKQ